MTPQRQAFLTPLPIVQAPMAGVQDSGLVIAVSQAGGLGSLPCAMLGPEALARQLDVIAAAGVDQYNLNFFCHEAPEPDAARDATWRDTLADYFREYEVDPDNIPASAGRQPFSATSLNVIQAYRPPVVSFHFGLPRREWVDAIKAWGGQVWSSATTLDEAQWLAENGADVIIAQGLEAGGHRGMFLSEDLSTQVGIRELLTQIVSGVEIPVVAAGGISTPEKAAAMIDAGAWAVQVGTAYLCCDEANTSDLHRELLKDVRPEDTQLTNLFSGRPARGIVNRLMREHGPLSDRTPAFPLASVALGPLRTAAEKQGRGDFSPLWCGTDASGCRSVGAADQTRWLARDLA